MFECYDCGEVFECLGSCPACNSWDVGCIEDTIKNPKQKFEDEDEDEDDYGDDYE